MFAVAQAVLAKALNKQASKYYLALIFGKLQRNHTNPITATAYYLT
jgi:hypothetical protein